MKTRGRNVGYGRRGPLNGVTQSNPKAPVPRWRREKADSDQWVIQPKEDALAWREATRRPGAAK